MLLQRWRAIGQCRHRGTAMKAEGDSRHKRDLDDGITSKAEGSCLVVSNFSQPINNGGLY